MFDPLRPGACARGRATATRVVTDVQHKTLAEQDVLQPETCGVAVEIQQILVPERTWITWMSASEATTYDRHIEALVVALSNNRSAMPDAPTMILKARFCDGLELQYLLHVLHLATALIDRHLQKSTQQRKQRAALRSANNPCSCKRVTSKERMAP